MIDHTLGVVLTGGASRRMGRDKASIVLDGATLLEHAVSVLSSVFSEVVISGVDAIGSDVPTIPDLVPGLGPLGGLASVYARADGRAVFLLAVDMPLVDEATVKALAVPAVAGTSVRVPVAEGRRQPLCAVYGSGLGPVVLDLLDGGDRSMESLFAAADLEEVTKFSPDVFTNVNTPDDLERALSRSDRHRNTR